MVVVGPQWVADFIARQQAPADVTPYLVPMLVPRTTATTSVSTEPVSVPEGVDEEGERLHRPQYTTPSSSSFSSSSSSSSTRDSNKLLVKTLKEMGRLYNALSTSEKTEAANIHNATGNVSSIMMDSNDKRVKSFVGVGGIIRTLDVMLTTENYEAVLEPFSGLGKSSLDVVRDVLRSGQSTRLTQLRQTEGVLAKAELCDVWGIGAAKAKTLVDVDGFTGQRYGGSSIDQLKAHVHKHGNIHPANVDHDHDHDHPVNGGLGHGRPPAPLLSDRQLTGLKYVRDYQHRMPRSEVEVLAARVAAVFEEVSGCSSSVLTICGSYRRGNASCGDVDLLFSEPDAGSFFAGVEDSASLELPSPQHSPLPLPPLHDTGVGVGVGTRADNISQASLETVLDPDLYPGPSCISSTLQAQQAQLTQQAQYTQYARRRRVRRDYERQTSLTAELIKRVVERLASEGFIKEHLTHPDKLGAAVGFWEDDKGRLAGHDRVLRGYMGICQSTTSGGAARRLDIKVYPL